MIYSCCNENRRNKLKGSNLNGIDYLEVLDRDAPSDKLRQSVLYIHFINSLQGSLSESNIEIEGGERIRGIRVTHVTSGKRLIERGALPSMRAEPDIVRVEVDQPGDFSTYTLRLVNALDKKHPPDGFDPILSSVEFSFKVECPTDFDCQPQRSCPPAQLSEPEIDYLAKDYGSFRQLLLDRMATLIPGQERNPADLGVALVELLAYVGDYLSYQQDAIATEAYLGTARRRTSVRRHARLVDYSMHDGCNARTWVQVQLTEAAHPEGELLAVDDNDITKKTCFLTRCQSESVAVSFDSLDRIIAEQHPEVFEPLHNAMLFHAHNVMHFYTWGDSECCLPKGATCATLKDRNDDKERLRLRPGDVLVFVERRNPLLGQAQDANPAHRHAVRLISVHPEAILNKENGRRTPGVRLMDPLYNKSIVNIEWAPEDAIPFPLCISSKHDEHVSVALGNIVLADHGLSRQLPLVPAIVPPPTLRYSQPPTADRCANDATVPIPARYRPHLQEGPLTYAAPFDATKDAAKPAVAVMHWHLKDARPAVSLAQKAIPIPITWDAKHDLLSSHADDTHFVVETEDDGSAYIRFGDGKLGKRPEPKTEFSANYRIGNGTAGNIGTGAIAHIVTALQNIEKVSNPLPAHGGTEPERLEDVRQRAPSAFRIQERAVTPEDYAEVTQRFEGKPNIQRAAATFRWTGSWYTVFVTVDPAGEVPDDKHDRSVLHTALERHLDHYRMAGHDVEIDWPRYVPLEIELFVCAKPDFFRSEVKRALLEVFSNRIMPNGQPGVFHPDNFSFGQTIYMSRLVAAAQTVPGVATVDVLKFQRRGRPDWKAHEDGKIELGRLEIARCDNSPNFPERGIFRVSMGGGK